MRGPPSTERAALCAPRTRRITARSHRKTTERVGVSVRCRLDRVAGHDSSGTLSTQSNHKIIHEEAKCFPASAIDLAKTQGHPLLADLLVERGLLAAEQSSLLDLLLRQKPHKHDGDAHASLAAGTTPDVRSVIESIADDDVQQLRSAQRVSVPTEKPLLCSEGHSSAIRRALRRASCNRWKTA